MVRVGINGFGRIGRQVLRVLANHPALDVVHINELGGDLPAAAHLLEFDSIQGRSAEPVTIEDEHLRIGRQRVSFSRNAEIEATRWRTRGVDLVIECTGAFKTTPALTPYLDGGVAKVVVGCPVKDGPLNVVMGVNDDRYDQHRHHIVTAASCTTNCIAPVIKVVHEAFGIRHGSITSIHDVTSTQRVLDNFHKDLRRARASGTSLIPTTTGSATAIAEIFPELRGRLDGHAVRVPVTNASLTDLVLEVEKPTTAAEVNARLAEAAAGPLKGILGYEERPLVSVDYVGDPRSSVVDAPSTLVVSDTQVKVYAWYDNEFGYANRLAELAARVAGSLPS
ncbi:MAG: ArsJ-associated glyceraldehyde-3-phosphate dehydrogenase [Pseudomonadota bacterium]